MRIAGAVGVMPKADRLSHYV